MSVLIYLALGVVLVGLRVPGVITRFAAREWSELSEWEAYDTFVVVILTIFGIIFWPIVVLGWIVWFIAKRTVHDRLAAKHAKAMEKA